MPSKPPSATGSRTDHRRAHDRKRRQEQLWRPLYCTARWQRTALHQLTIEPLCANCLKHGRVTAATICDHIDPDSKLTV